MVETMVPHCVYFDILKGERKPSCPMLKNCDKACKNPRPCREGLDLCIGTWNGRCEYYDGAEYDMD